MRPSPHLILGIAVSVAACASDTGRKVPIDAAFLDHGTSLSLTVEMCDPGEYSVTVSERADPVRITVKATRERRSDGNSCTAGLNVNLQKPLGERDLIDGSTGKQIYPAVDDD